ncbi:ATP synthase F1 subunit gamma [bacterium]|jgi:F-type H+-transporting ATPase subunit gamma|nr:ATP synthase F1 subunit gamma [bacterium]
MAKTRELVVRRKAIRNIRKITRTMELIATARFKKAMDRTLEAAAYTKKISEVAAELSASAQDVKHPLLEKRDKISKRVLLVICSNRGLCGGYNAGILREATLSMQASKSRGEETVLELSGKRAIAFFKYQQIEPVATYVNFEDKPRFDEVEPLADKFMREFTLGNVDAVDVAFMKFQNPARQFPVVETILPFSKLPGSSGETNKKSGNVSYEFLPNAEEILEELLPQAFKASLFKCFLDAAVSEQIARRVTMKAATENADDMIKAISLLYNRARQAQITKEISEIIGGAAALE